MYQGSFSQFDHRYEGHIELGFKTVNPVDNQGITNSSYVISIYDDTDLLYGIDQLIDVLYPQLGCQYPCKSCLPSDKAFCTECLP